LVLAVLVALLSPPMALPADDDDAPAPARTTGRSDTGGFTLDLSQQRQRQGGLKTQPLAAFALGEEIRAYGRVVDISPVLELRARYRSAQSELAIADAALQVAQKTQARLARLHSEAIVPTRELAQAESQLAADRARRDAAGRHVVEVREQALQSVGDDVFRLAVEAESRLFEGLLNHAQVLALVALPAGQHLPKQLRQATLAPGGERGKARSATLLAAAPRTEESTQGETWYFVAAAAGLRAGMRLDVWLPLGGVAARGVLIPHSAVVWRDGRPWVFVKTGAEVFARRAVDAPVEQGGAWFVAQGFAPGEDVVVVGGQMLLSEEQRRNAPKDGDAD
jgi:hypothetical protein